MRIPNLKDVFYDLFCQQKYSPSDHNYKRFVNLLNAAGAKYQIPFQDSEELYSNFMDCVLEERYCGFLSGFGWAVLLFTGKAPKIDTEDSSDKP